MERPPAGGALPTGSGGRRPESNRLRLLDAGDVGLVAADEVIE